MIEVSLPHSLYLIFAHTGILRYRGYGIEQLAEKSSFLEVAFLLLYGELPTASQLKHFVSRIASESSPHTDIIELIHTFR